jgi:hypothetical protein
MGALGIILTILFLIVLSVGGYFGYQKLYRPMACNSKSPDLTSNVSTFVWSSNVCVANTCTQGHGDSSGNPVNGACPLFAKQYTPGTGGPDSDCTVGVGGSSIAQSEKVDNSVECENLCEDDTTCLAFDWNGVSTPGKCLLYTGNVVSSFSGSNCMFKPK